MATFLFVVPRFHTNLFFATRALIATGHRVEVAAARIAGTEDHSHLVPIEIGRTPDAATLKALMGKITPDLVLVRGPDRLSSDVARAARGSGSTVLRYDQRPYTRRTSLGRRLKNALAGRPAKRVTPIPGLASDAPPDPMAHYVPFPVEASPVEPRARDHDDGPVRILCVGKLWQRRKNQPLVIDALRRLDAPDRRIALTLVGSSARTISGADEAHYDMLADAARTSDWIDLRVDVPFDEMAGLYARHDICVLPSVDEPLGSAPIEAMAYGTIPVISTGAGSAGYIDDGRTGFRVNVTEAGALERVFRRLVDDPASRAALSQAARRFAETELSPARYVARMEALLPRRR